MMDAVTRYSTDAVVQSTRPNASCYLKPIVFPRFSILNLFRTTLRSKTRCVKTIFNHFISRVDQSHVTATLKMYLNQSTEIFVTFIGACRRRAVFPPMITWTTFKCLLHCYVQMSLFISTDLYGNATRFSNKRANGYTSRIDSSSFLTQMSSDIFSARRAIQARRKLNLMLHPELTLNTLVCTSDHVQMYIKEEQKRRCSCSALKPVLVFDSPSQTVTITG